MQLVTPNQNQHMTSELGRLQAKAQKKRKRRNI